LCYFCLSIVANMRFLRPILLLFFLPLHYLAAGQTAVADEVTINQGETVTIRILDNDGESRDPSTVDLDPGSGDIQKTYSTDRGTFTADEQTGVVTFVPLPTATGQTQARYTFRYYFLGLPIISNSAPITVNITAVANVAPAITGQNNVSVPEEGMLSLAVTDLLIDDPDDTYPGGFSLTVRDGANYTVSGTTIMPAPNFAGTLTVPVSVNDGEAESNVFDLQVIVTPVNDPPVITGQQPLETPEDTPITLALESLQVSDPDNNYPADFTLQVEAGANYTVSGTTITPANNFVGILSVPVTVNDGALTSASKLITVTVQPVNDAPTITGQVAVNMNEDASLTINLNHITVADPDNNYPTGFTITVLDGTNYTATGNAIRPTQNFNGTLTVNVKVSDGISESNVFGLQVTVRPVNDIPVITGQIPVSVAEAQPIPLNLSMLTVSDPDNDYPDDFSLIIISGPNYSVTDNVVTPVANFSGTLQVNVQVSDGAATSAQYKLQIQVNSTNDAPVITGQKSLSTNEEQAITLQLSDLTVTDPDSPYPTGFSLIVLPGNNYTVSGTSVTPAVNFNGTLSVSVKVNDGSIDSAPFPVQITVNPINDAPVITGQQAVSTPEDRAITLEFTHLNVSDPDNTYPSGFSMTVGSGNNYTVSGRTITPVENYNGTLTVPVTVNDGQASSNSFNLRITVTPVNDPPVITGQNPVATDEDKPVTIQLTHLIVTDVDNTYPTGFSLSVQPGNNYTVGTGNRITPANNFTGTLSVSVTVSDGAASSAPFNLKVTVNDENDIPVITGQVALSVQEDEAITLKLSDLIVTDSDDPYPTGFTMTVKAGTNYTVSGLVVTPAKDFSGTLTVPVTVNDGKVSSASFNLKIEVIQINDAPGFAKIADIQVAENSPAKTITITGVTKGINENNQQLTWVVSSSNEDVVKLSPIEYVQTANTATLKYEVQKSRSGTATISVTVVDNGSGIPPNVNTYSQTFTITVSDINDAPTLDLIENKKIPEDAPLTPISLTGITAGLGEETQDIIVSVEAAKPELFETLAVVYTNRQSTGTLQIKPKPNANGSSQITVTVKDSGPGSPTPNVNTFKQSFTLTITPVNDAPVFVSTPTISVSVGELYDYQIIVTDVDNETLALTVPVKPAWLTYTAEGNGKGRLKGTPPEGASGRSPVKISVKDSGTPVLQEYEIVINARPAIRSFTIQSQEDKVVNFTQQQFNDAYSDADGNAMSEIMLTALPRHGTLRLGGSVLQGGESIVIPAASINQMTYTPVAEYSGLDTLLWKASDGVDYSRNEAYVEIVMPAVNDAPVVQALETDSLHYEVGNETPRQITETFTAFDIDDDSLASAEVGFRRQNHNPLNDRLTFTPTARITGVFDNQAGILSLTGKAPLEEYTQVIRSIQYNYINLTDITLNTKNIYITLNDGKTFSETKDRLVTLIYTFKDLDIPTGFTPNGDNANDYWKISSAKGLEQYKDAEVRVFDRRGTLIYEAIGFEQPWDGTFRGQRLPVDSYYYTIDLKYNRVQYKGVVTILR